MKKKVNKKEKINSANHTDVILEDINSKFDFVVESVSGLNGKIDRVSDELVEFKEETRNNFKAVANAFTEVNDRMDTIEDKVDRVQDDVTEIKHKLSEKVDLKDFQNLEKRFMKLEKLVFAKLAN